MLDIMCSKSYKNLNQYLGSLEKKIPRYISSRELHRFSINISFIPLIFRNSKLL